MIEDLTLTGKLLFTGFILAWVAAALGFLWLAVRIAAHAWGAC